MKKQTLENSGEIPHFPTYPVSFRDVMICLIAERIILQRERSTQIVDNVDNAKIFQKHLSEANPVSRKNLRMSENKL